MYRHILIPVDGSETSRAALRHALKLAKEEGARVRLVYVLEKIRHVVTEGVVDLTAAMRREGESFLDEALREARAGGVDATTALVEAGDRPIAEAIVNEATAAHSDLIAIGTHGRRSVERLLLGSVAEGVLRRATGTVLLIRGN